MHLVIHSPLLLNALTTIHFISFLFTSLTSTHRLKYSRKKAKVISHNNIHIERSSTPSPAHSQVATEVFTAFSVVKSARVVSRAVLAFEKGNNYDV